jgi:hypothetical protein
MDLSCRLVLEELGSRQGILSNYSTTTVLSIARLEDLVR